MVEPAPTSAAGSVGTIETHLISGTQSEVRSGMETTTQQTPQSGGAVTYNGSFSVGVPSPAFDLVSDSSGDGSSSRSSVRVRAAAVPAPQLVRAVHGPLVVLQVHGRRGCVRREARRSRSRHSTQKSA